MPPLNPFIQYFVEEAHKKQSFHQLQDADFNRACFELHDTPVNITPRAIQQDESFSYQQPKELYVYPSKADSKAYLEKAEQLIEAIHGVSNQIVFQIQGNKDEVTCCFYGEESDLNIIDSAIRTFYPNVVTEIQEPKYYDGDYFVYDFIAKAPFYKSLTSFEDFVVSPLNLVPQLFLNLEKIGFYQVVFTPLSGEIHELVKQAIDTEWKALQGIERQILPSLQENSEKLDYKVPDFRSYYSACCRLLLPVDSLTANVKAFISNYTYGSKAFNILDNHQYSQNQIIEMLNSRVSYHTGFLVNSKELTSLLHIPYQVLYDKNYNEVFGSAPVGDKPNKTIKYEDIQFATWACGTNSKDIHLPVQKEIPHVHVLGVSRVGKSILLSHIALEKFKRREAVFVIDPHGDLITNIQKMIPKNRINDVVVIDFGLKNMTPQITIRENIDITNPSKASDDLADSMRNITSGREQSWWGPKMAYYFTCLFYIYSVLPDLNLTHIRLLISNSKKARVLRTKVKAQISHPIVIDFLEELELTPYESLMPVVTRLSHLLLDEKSLKLFTLTENKISISDIMKKGKLCLVNLSIGSIGKQRSSIMAGLMDSLINNTTLARANSPYEKRKPCTIIKDEFYLGPGDLDAQLTGLAKYGISVVFAHQYLSQVDGYTREVMATAGTRIVFKVRRVDAEIMGQDFGIDPEEFTALKKFQAIVKIEDEVVKINTPKPVFNQVDYSQEIMGNCLEKYYLWHEERNKPMMDLTYDTL